MADIRDLPRVQQAVAYRITIVWSQLADRREALSPRQALDLLGLTGEEAARFERLRGKRTGLEWDGYQYVPRSSPEWRRRLR